MKARNSRTPQQMTTSSTSQESAQGPMNGSGSAMVLGTTSAQEIARSGTAMPELLALLQGGASLDEAMKELSTSQITGSGDVELQGYQQFPTLASVGLDSDSPAPAKKSAVFIANAHYDDPSVWPDLEAATAESQALQSELAASHPDQLVDEDADADVMGTFYRYGMAMASPGDEVVLHYAGHGSEQGLVGVGDDGNGSDILANADVSSLARSAVGKGVHARIILDSCHSGAQVQRVRDEEISAFAGDGGSSADNAAQAAIAARSFKQAIEPHLKPWTEAETHNGDAVVAQGGEDALLIQDVVDRISGFKRAQAELHRGFGTGILAMLGVVRSQKALGYLEDAQESVEAGRVAEAASWLELVIDAENRSIDQAKALAFRNAANSYAFAVDEIWSIVREDAMATASWLDVDTADLPHVVWQLSQAQRLVQFMDELQEAALERARSGTDP